MSESEQEAIAGLRWNDSISVALFTVMSYEYLLLLDKEIKYVWKRPWSVMSCLYLVVRYLGLSLAIIWGCWGGMFYIPESPYVSLNLFQSQVPTVINLSHSAASIIHASN
ncbi:hypothetical protein DFJ58DRAFT_269102 [Suillus subalutaceus]|uniref:uncharacterized protein n=1 Tax=Suillus subalutaceus TaxID=48586 RepID=UPI001B86C148|nr:uncharacterized protein DFJ58DRAFT_269102 [Suillus subalutaceus]KAG1860638.1 hypothetical protein DFJ58DRAFT_269102 [Suillus subalutaceus]